MKTKERIKTILIFVLLFGAIFSTYLIWTGYMSAPAGTVGEITTTTVAAQNAEPAPPFAISYKNDKGRFGAAYHGGSVSLVYEPVRPLILKALTGDEKPIKTESGDWNKALTQKGFLVDYEGNIPLFLIAESDSDICFRYLILTYDALYIKNSLDGSVYEVSHDLTKDEIDRVMGELNATKCTTAYEAGSSRVVGETLVFDGNISTFTINSSTSVSELSEAQLVSLLKIFNMNYNTCGKHTEQDGSKVYIEDLSTLKIAPDGYITFESEEEGEMSLAIRSEGAIPTMKEIVEGADTIMASLSAYSQGEAQTYIREVDSESVKFGRSFGGVPIDRSGTGYSAELYLSGNRVTRLCFHLRTYTKGNGTISALPQKLAIASVPGKTYGTISLRYNDNASGGIDAQWYVKK